MLKRSSDMRQCMEPESTKIRENCSFCYVERNRPAGLPTLPAGSNLGESNIRFPTIVASGLLGLALLSMGQARAAPLRLIYDGYLSADPNALDTLNGTALPSPTPFSVRAEFDSSQPNFFLCGVTPCPG